MKQPPLDMSRMSAKQYADAHASIIGSAPRPTDCDSDADCRRFIRRFRTHLLRRARLVFRLRGVPWKWADVYEIAERKEQRLYRGTLPLIDGAALVAVIARELLDDDESLSAERRVTDAIQAMQLLAYIDSDLRLAAQEIAKFMRSRTANRAKSDRALDRVQILRRAIEANEVKARPMDVVRWRGLDKTKANQTMATRDIAAVRKLQAESKQRR